MTHYIKDGNKYHYKSFKNALDHKHNRAGNKCHIQENTNTRKKPKCMNRCPGRVKFTCCGHTCRHSVTHNTHQSIDSEENEFDADVNLSCWSHAIVIAIENVSMYVVGVRRSKAVDQNVTCKYFEQNINVCMLC